MPHTTTQTHLRTQSTSCLGGSFFKEVFNWDVKSSIGCLTEEELCLLESVGLSCCCGAESVPLQPWVPNNRLNQINWLTLAALCFDLYHSTDYDPRLSTCVSKDRKSLLVVCHDSPWHLVNKKQRFQNLSKWINILMLKMAGNKRIFLISLGHSVIFKDSVKIWYKIYSTWIFIYCSLVNF